jgi:sugar phosphate permease
MVDKDRGYPRWYPWMVATGALLAFATRWLHNVYPFTVTNIIEELGVEPSRVAFMVSANAVGVIIGGFLIGLLADRFGVRVTLSLAATLTGVFTVLVGFSTNIYMAILFFGLAGLFSLTSCAFPKITRAWFSQSLYSSANAYMFLGFRITAVLMGPLVASIVFMRGWRAAWIELGTACIVLGALACTLLRDRKDSDYILKNVSIAKVLKCRDVWLLFAVSSCWFWGGTLYANYTIMYFTKALKVDIITAGWLWSLLQVAGLVSMYTLLPLSDLLTIKKIMYRKDFAALLYFEATLAFIVFGLLKPGMHIAYYILGCILMGPALSIVSMISPLTSERVSTEVAGTAGGFITATSYWTWIVASPLLSTLISTYGWSIAWITSAIAIATGGIILLLMRPPPLK